MSGAGGHPDPGDRGKEETRVYRYWDGRPHRARPAAAAAAAAALITVQDPVGATGCARLFPNAHGPAVKQFRPDLAQRWPEIQHLGIGFEDASGHSRGGIVIALDDPGQAAESDITHVMVRLKAPELEIVDTLITAGVANSRAEAIRWALARISERPAYAQLREHIRDIQRLTTEF
jgi:hypothetical protein